MLEALRKLMLTINARAQDKSTFDALRRLAVLAIKSGPGLMKQIEGINEMADRYETALADTVAAEAALTGARAELLDAIGDGRWATVAGRRVAQRTVRNGRTYSLIPCKKKASTP